MVATKYILNEYRNDYKLRLLTLNMLPLMFKIHLMQSISISMLVLLIPTQELVIANYNCPHK